MPNEARLAKRTSAHLDMIRGVSAVAVLLYHTRGHFFVDFPYVTKKSIFAMLFYAATSYGHQAVMIFFVLSGYFIGTSVMESVGAQPWSWPAYLVSRITRLQLVLFPALVLGAVWDQIGIRIPQAASLYVGPLYKFSGPSVELRSTLPVFFGNFFYLQSIVSPVFGSNGPLWSLSYEFWYYLLFPALILAAAARERPRGRILHAVLALLLVFFLGTRITAYFAIWLVGALVGRFQRSTNFRTSSPALPLAGGLLFAGSLAWCRLRPLSSDYLTDLIVGCCFALWLYTLLLGSRDDVSPAYEHGARKLAGFSYTLYLTHFPLLLLLRGLFDPQSTWQPDARHLACGLAIALGMLVYAYSVAELTEAHTASVRRGILRRIAPLEIPART